MARARKKAEDEAPPVPDRLEGAPHPAETARLFGHAAAEAAVLEAWAQGRPAHGWLLQGPEGVGKATLAYRIARMAIAGDARLDAPGDCPVARRIRAGSEPRLKVLRRQVNADTGKLKTRIAIEDVRAVKTFLHLSAADGGWRVVIVDPADEMTVPAANALLKLLEEPPAATLFLLLSHAPGGLLATVRSRCRRLVLRPLDPGPLAAALAGAGHPVDAARAGLVAALAGGSAGRALRLVAADGLALYDRLAGLLGPDGVARDRLPGLAGAVSGSAREKAPLVVALTATLLARLARAAALGHPPDAALEAERAVMAGLSPAQAEALAEAATALPARADEALAVNLDPGQTILDMWLDIDAALRRPSRPIR